MPTEAVVAGLLVLALLALGLSWEAEHHREVLLRVGSEPRTDGSSGRPRLAMHDRPIVVSAAAGVVGAGVGSLLVGALGVPLGAGVGALVPWAIRRRRAARRAAELADQLADAISAIAAGSRSGLSLVQSVAFAADQVGEPLGSSIREVSDRTTLGSPLDEALGHWVERIPVGDVRLVAAVLRLHRRTGGSLPSVLDRLARTLRDRRTADREVRSLTAQARLSGAILGLLPIGFFVFLSITSKSDIADALRSPVGAAAVATGLVLQGLAFLWIRRLLRVEA